jgi:hypothetical protein
MRRRYVLWLLAASLFSGCTMAFEDGWQDSMQLFEFGAASPKATTLVLCDPVNE